MIEQTVTGLVNAYNSSYGDDAVNLFYVLENILRKECYSSYIQQNQSGRTDYIHLRGNNHHIVITGRGKMQ